MFNRKTAPDPEEIMRCMEAIEIKNNSDYVKVVKCKNCTYCQKRGMICTLLDIHTIGDWYCASGRRIESDDSEIKNAI